MRALPHFSSVQCSAQLAVAGLVVMYVMWGSPAQQGPMEIPAGDTSSVVGKQLAGGHVAIM